MDLPTRVALVQTTSPHHRLIAAALVRGVLADPAFEVTVGENRRPAVRKVRMRAEGPGTAFVRADVGLRDHLCMSIRGLDDIPSEVRIAVRALTMTETVAALAVVLTEPFQAELDRPVRLTPDARSPEPCLRVETPAPTRGRPRARPRHGAVWLRGAA